MPILTMQRRMRELGRIRMGEKGDRGQPRKLATFRLTSANREYLDAAAEAYRGTVTPWESPRGPEWQLTIAAPHLDVIIPPEVGVDPWLELWTGGGCLRRCDGITERLSGQPCMCPSDPKARQEAAGKGEACKPTTRLSVCLPALPDLGVWRLESHGYYAAVELSGMAEVLRAAALQGVMLPARLRIERRQVKRPNEPRKDFTVPVLEIPTRLGSILPEGPLTVPRIGAPAAAGRPALPPGPELPASSGLRAPAPAPEAVEEAVFSDADDPEADEDRETLVATLRGQAERSGLTGRPTAPQNARLKEAFAGMAPEAIQAGLKTAFGHERLATAAEAQAVVTVADSLGDEDFRAAWARLAS